MMITKKRPIDSIGSRADKTGYSVEDRCMLTPFIPHSERSHRGLTLAKRADYFTPTQSYAWPGLLPKIIDRMPPTDNGGGEKFEIVATAGGTLDADLGVRNLGTFPRERWLQEVAKSKFMVSFSQFLARVLQHWFS